MKYGSISEAGVNIVYLSSDTGFGASSSQESLDCLMEDVFMQL